MPASNLQKMCQTLTGARTMPAFQACKTHAHFFMAHLLQAPPSPPGVARILQNRIVKFVK